VVPISILIILFREQIVGLILKTGQFGLVETKLTAVCLGIFSISIFAQSLIPLLSRVFFSLQDTKTPTLATFLGVTLNIIMAVSFIQLLGCQNPLSLFVKNLFNLQTVGNISIIGLPLAFSISAIFQFFLLYILFFKRIKSVN
jgi:putative peptidoglycan lipid II flippase